MSDLRSCGHDLIFVSTKPAAGHLTKTIAAGRAAGVISERSAETVIVDTTVMEKAIAHPTDTRLYEKARRRLVALAQ
jgi:IS5 family transposase